MTKLKVKNLYKCYIFLSCNSIIIIAINFVISINGYASSKLMINQLIFDFGFFLIGFIFILDGYKKIAKLINNKVEFIYYDKRKLCEEVLMGNLKDVIGKPILVIIGFSIMILSRLIYI